MNPEQSLMYLSCWEVNPIISEATMFWNWSDLIPAMDCSGIFLIQYSLNPEYDPATKMDSWDALNPAQLVCGIDSKFSDVAEPNSSSVNCETWSMVRWPIYTSKLQYLI